MTPQGETVDSTTAATREIEHPVHQPRRIAMVCSSHDQVDGIVDYARGLGEAIVRLHDVAGRLVVRRAGGWSSETLGEAAGPHPVDGLARAVEGCDALLLHYNPFSWGRWGFAPSLLRTLATLRVRRSDLEVGVVMHERYVEMHDGRSVVMGSWQRLQYHAVLRAATTAFASIERWTTDLRTRTGVPVAQIPICSNLPDGRAARQSTRATLGVDGSCIVIATFGNEHESRLAGHIERAVHAIAMDGTPVLMLNLGANPPRLPALERSPVRVLQPGLLEPSEIAAHLAASDVFLAPFSDGVSARRTTLMAALQHGLPVVGTLGASTDGAMRDAREALLLTPAADADAFAAAAGELAADPSRRGRQGAAARALYAADHDWPAASRIALDGLSRAAARRR